MDEGVSPEWATDSETWRSGDWSIERRGDELADIRFRGAVVLRSIRAVVRDHDWNTPDLVVDEVAAGAEALELSVHTEGFGARISGAVRVEAAGDRLEVTWTGSSGVDYLTNRTGLVVLHPPRLAGHPLTVTHPDDRREDTAFPEDISPHQPVVGIAALAWRDRGLDVEIAFHGDVFEMEDQRNWTDASYKTYSRPLALPFPYLLSAGEELRQRIEVRAQGVSDPADDAPPALVLRAAGPFPEILSVASTAPDPVPDIPATDGEVPSRTLLVELDLGAPNWRAALERASRRGLALDVRLVLPEDGEEGAPLHAASLDALDEAAEALAPLPVRRIAAFTRLIHSARRETTLPLRAAMERAGMTAHVLGGVRSHFTELNREQHLIPDDADGIAFAVTPLFHALGTEQLVESVAMQRLVARQAVRIAGLRPVHVGPITLRPRFNNVATLPQPVPTRADLAEGYGAAFTSASDPRQEAPELAAWTIASAAALAVPGVASLCFFEEWGPRGIRDDAGRPRPIAAALAALAELEGGELLTADSPDGRTWAVGSRTQTGMTALVANLSPEPRTVAVRLDAPHGGPTHPVTLSPFAWTRLTL